MMGNLIIILMSDADKIKPGNTPEHTGLVDKITPMNFSHQGTDQYEWYHQQHQEQESQKRIDQIDDPKRE